MTISAYDWTDYCLLVTVRNRNVTAVSYLLCHVSQEDFLEHYIEQWAVGRTERDVVIMEMGVHPLTEDSYLALADYWPENQRLGD